MSVVDCRPWVVRRIGLADYCETFAAMQGYTAARGETGEDALWLCEHPPVFTQGLSGKAEHVLADIGVPVVRIDRGGQVTYHGPGQLLAYLLLDLRRRGLKVRDMVWRIEQALIDLLADYDIAASRRDGAPGVYVEGAKIAALGLRIKNGCSYHGLSLNVDMDLSPFAAINPCGYPGMAVTQLRDHGGPTDIASIGDDLARHLEMQLS